MRNNLFVSLVHYPVYNKNEEIVATSVTNFDIHDISRTSKTYVQNDLLIASRIGSRCRLS